MPSRSLLLFASQISRESRRVDSTVIRVLYCGFAVSILWTVHFIDQPDLGLALLRAMTVVHSAMAVVLAVRLSGDIAGNRSSGLVGLMALAGLPSQQAVVSHLLLGMASFLSVWLVRVPILCLAFHLGGTSLHQILHLEMLLLGLFSMTYCAGLLLAHYSNDRTTSRMIFLFPSLLELLFTLPSLVVSTTQYLLAINIPQFVEIGVENLRYFRLSSCLFYTLRATSPSLVYLIPAAIHGGIALLSLWAWRRVYYARLDEADVPEVHEQPIVRARPSTSKSRASRPVWDDALAWQAYYVHSDGRWNIIGRSLTIVVSLMVTLALASQPTLGLQGLGITILVITTLILMFIGRGKVSDCLLKEIKEKTLPTLLLTPHSSKELVDGWGRGARQLMRPDWIQYAACLVGVIMYGPMNLAPVIVGGAILIQASEPFLILSPLVPFSLKGIACGLGLIAVVIGMLIVAGPLSVQIHPWLGTASLIPMAWGWNRLCQRLVPRWLALKQDELA